MKGVQLTIFIFFAVLATVHALECYKCTGTDERDSKDKVETDKSKQMACPLGMDKCMRTWAKKDGDTVVITSCGNDATCKVLKQKCDDSKDGDCAVS